MGFGFGPLPNQPAESGLQYRSPILPRGVDNAGQKVWAWPGFVVDAFNAAQFPGQVYRGEKEVFDPATGHVSHDAIVASTGMAGLGGLAGGTNFVRAAGPKALPAAEESLVSRGATMYDPVPRAARSITDDYKLGRWPDGPPKDASGRLTHDIEGRVLNPDARVVGTRRVGEAGAPLTPAELDTFATAITGQPPVAASQHSLGQNAGLFNRVQSIADDAALPAGVRPERTDSFSIQFSKNLSPEQKTRVVAHETGHGIDYFAGAPYFDKSLRTDWRRISPDIKNISTEMKGLYNELNNPEFPAGLRAARGDPDLAPRQGAKYRGFTPQEKGYRHPDEVNAEYWAEAIRAYMTDPNAMKSMAPETAKRIRAAVNTNPILSPHIQFNSLAGAGLLGAGALAAGSDRADSAELPKGSAMNAGVSSLPGLPAGLTAEDLARMLGQAAPAGGQGFGFGGPVGAPQGVPQPVSGIVPFGQFPPAMPQGGPPPVIAENEAAVRQAEAGMMPRGFGAAPRGQMSPAPQPMPQAQQFLGDGDPMPSVRAPLPPPRPSGFGFSSPPPQPASQADMPAVGAVPTAGTMPPAAAPQSATASPATSSGFMEKWKTLADSGFGDTLIGLGTGLMSTKGFGNGLAAGFQNAQKYGAQRAVTDLARGELALKTGKVKRETEANNSTVNLLVRKGYALEDARSMVAASAGGRSEALSAALTNAFPKADAGFRIDPATGVQTYSPGGPQDPDTIRRQKMAGEYSPQQLEERSAAQARGTAAGTPDAPYNLSKGQVRYDGDGKVIAQGPPDKPDGFDVETKLRNEFGKNLGTFGDVHDGYNRVIAATQMRATNPAAKSPASDIGLIFGYMKMLDPGSVVREGEYATAKNAAGLDDRMRNTYNRLLDGEFLTPDQRQDFLGQAAQLYGKARGTAEGVAERYRGLAGQYGVDPGRSVYLPDMPNPPSVGRQRGTSPSPAVAPDRSVIEAEMRRRGLR